MNSTAIDTAEILQDAGIGSISSQSDWGIFYGQEPVRPNNCITVYDSGGFEAIPEADLTEPAIQIRVRANDYSAGYAKCLEIRDYLINFFNQVKNSSLYVLYVNQGDILALGTNENNRFLWTMNFRIIRTGD